MQPAVFSNRFFLGTIAFIVSFGLSLIFKWNFGEAVFTGITSVMATYIAAFFVDKRRRNYEMLILDSYRKRIRELEGVESNFIAEINQLENHRNSLYFESNQLQSQVNDRRNQRDTLNRELGSFAGQKQQLEATFNRLRNEIENIETRKIELNNSFAAEKRKQDLNVNVCRAEITQLQLHIAELNKQKEEFENNLTLLERLKPQLEEKLHELRVNIQELEVQENHQIKIISEKVNERNSLDTKIKSLQTKLTTKQEEFKHLQNQISLLQDEHNLLQSQVWELLQQIDKLNSNNDNIHLNQNDLESELEAEAEFPFADLLDIEPISKSTQVEPILKNLAKTLEISDEWNGLSRHLSNFEFQVLKAILELENSNPAIKQIAEANITMPSLLIDAINEKANNTIGELIIDTTCEYPKIYTEHINHVKEIVEAYEAINRPSALSN
jgi:chromosome segregation ATPase